MRLTMMLEAPQAQLRSRKEIDNSASIIHRTLNLLIFTQKYNLLPSAEIQFKTHKFCKILLKI
jgi:hypothetical protein